MKPFSLLGCLALLAPFSSALPASEAKPKLEARASTSWWLANVDHFSGAVRGFVPGLTLSNGQPNYNYPVWKSINPGDGQGLVNAITSDGASGGSRDNCWLSMQPRVLYLPPGVYEVSSTIYLLTDTIIIGDATSPPTIRAKAGFQGDYLMVGGQGDGADHPCGGSGGETHFSVMLKNINLDTSFNSGNGNFVALSWAVAQNCALVNTQIFLPSNAHTGIMVSGGSTISISDVGIFSGAVGLHWNGHQQGQIKNLRFTKTTRGIVIDGGWTISILAPVCDTVGYCITLNSGNPWVAVIDGQSWNSGDFFTSNMGFPNFMLENISKDTTNSNMVVVGGAVKVGGSTSIGTYIYGNVYGANPVYQANPSSAAVNRPSKLAPGGRYPILSAPQYADNTGANVVNLKDPNQNGGHTLAGDGNTDDTAALQAALNTAASQGKIAFLPFGVYRVTWTITIPSGTRLYGEGWPAISGSGGAFANEASPIPVVQVGNPGQVGTAVIQDMRFTVREALPGAVLVRVNMKGNKPGDVAIYNSLNTIGGTRDTTIDCSYESNCRAAYLGLHLAAGSSAYIDNFWSWVADHPVDGTGKGTRTAVKGGVLVEATDGTWLTGLGSEHNWLYQLSLHNAANVMISLFQSETNYNQGAHGAPLPGSPFNALSYDPNFSWCGGNDSVCRMGLAQWYVGSNDNIWHYAAASWNFQSLTQVSQGLMNYIHDGVSNAHLHGYTDGPDTSMCMRLPSGKQFGNGNNDGFGGAWNTLIADLRSQS